MKNKELLYLSAAPRVSTKECTETFGARSHIVGVQKGFKKNNFIVNEYIVGNFVPEKWIQSGSEKKNQTTFLKLILMDIMRIYLSIIHSKKALKRYTNSKLVYERLCLFKSLGASFKKKGAFWILESNAVLYEEATNDRRTVFFKRLARRYEFKNYQEADLIVVISEELKSLIVRRFNISAKKILTIPNGIDEEIFFPLKQNFLCKKEIINIGFVGNIMKWQGLNFLIEAIFQLKEEAKLNIELTIIGDGLEKNNLIHMIDQLDLKKQIHFIGIINREFIPEKISQFDICFSGQIPLKSGSMYLSPLKLYEYAAMGKPILASKYSDSMNVIKHGVTGNLFIYNIENDLKLNLVEMIENIEIYKKNSLKYAEEIINYHSWKKRVQLIIDKL